MDYRLPGSSVHEILQVRILEWVAMPSPPGNISNPGTESVSLIPPALADGFFITSATWETLNILFSSVAQSYLTLQPNRLQHTRLPCPSPTSRAYSNSCSSSRWCHPTISSSVIPFSCFQCFPALGSFPMSQPFASGGQSIEVSPSTSVLPMNIQSWFPLGLTSLISLLSEGLSRAFSSTTVQSISSLELSLLFGPTLTSIHHYWKKQSFD